MTELSDYRVAHPFDPEQSVDESNFQNTEPSTEFDLIDKLHLRNLQEKFFNHNNEYKIKNFVYKLKEL